ncbi:MAG: hypothetical protein H0T51_02290 [Pirellulales bacterium]|nr:hypothetical protein [Pirellulales bacterium]
MAGRKNQRAAELNIGVAFGGVSFGDKTARIGVQIARDYIELDKADELFCDRRLHGLVVLGHADDDPRQFLALDDIQHTINAVFDVKGFKVNAETLGIGLTFAKAELVNGELERFAKSSGRLIVTKSEDIPLEKPTAAAGDRPMLDDDDDADEDFEDAEMPPEGAAV